MPLRGAGAGAGGSGSGASAAVTIRDVDRYAFTQHLMKAGVMPEAKAKEAFARLTGSDDDAAFKRLIADQNQDLAALKLKIRIATWPSDRERYVALVNTHADAASKFGTRYTPLEREFFRAVMEAIALDDEASDGHAAASSITLLNLEVRPPAAAAPTQGAGPSQAAQTPAAAPAGKLTKAAREAALHKLTADGWLDVGGGRDGTYCLGPRTFLELGAALLELPGLPEDTRRAWQDVV